MFLWTAIWSFLRRHWRGTALIALVLLATIAVLAYGRSQFTRGKERAEQQIAAAAAEQAARVRVTQAATEARNEQVYRAFAASVDAINADRAGLSHRLRDYEIRGRPVPAAPGEPGTAATREKPGGPSEADGLLDAYDTACRLDAAQLNALIDQVRAQLGASP